MWQTERSEELWEEYRKKRNALVAAIRKAKKDHWEAFLGAAQGEDLWTVIRYTRKGMTGGALLSLVGPDGSVAGTGWEKARVLADVSFPPPAVYDGNEVRPG